MLQIDFNQLTDELSKQIHSVFGSQLNKIILYGSYARGDFTSDSDLDIMVLAEFSCSEKEVLQKKIDKIASEASLKSDITVSILLREVEFFNNRMSILPFYQNVVSEGVEIYAH